MARKSGSTILQEELYPPYAGNSHPNSREEIDDARLVDLDVAEESPFLRAQKRVSARRSSLPKKTVNLLLWGCVAVGVLGMVALGIVLLQHYGEHSWRFRLDSSDNIEVTGIENVTKKQIMEVMGEDIQRNIFSVPLKDQKAKLEQIPWVESASVMRFVPNRLKIEIHERTPVAFARVGPRIFLIDAGGTLMELPQKHKYSFPVILGMYPGEPLSTRVPRMRAFNELMQQLDSGGAHYSQDLSEVDLSDLENLKVRVNDTQGDVLVELGSYDYLKRYRTYVSHVQEWRQQFQKLESVNLRYDNQVIVNPDMEGKPKQAALSASAAKAAAAAGVKSAALITRINPHDRSLPKPAFELHEKNIDPKAAVKKPAKPKAKKVVAHAAGPKKELVKHSAPAHPSTGKPEGKKTSTSLAANARHPKPSPAVAKPSAGQN
jgi:cell division protein FtsQ